MGMKDNRPTEDMKELLRKAGDPNPNVAIAASEEIAKAVTVPIREGVLSGDITADVYETIDFDPGVPIEFPLDTLAPGTEAEYVAYTIPNVGRLPERHVESDYVTVPVYPVGNAIDWSIDLSKDARWDVAKRNLGILEAGFVKKFNDDGWHALLSAAVDRNILVFDSDAAAGQFTKRLVSLMKTIMLRNGGGNSNSLNRRKLTDLFLSPEGIEDIRNWGVDQIDEVTRREVFEMEDGMLSRIFGVNLRELTEIGTSQEYQLYVTSTLGATLGSGDVEIVVGMDLSKRNFVMPIREKVQIFPDPLLHRQRRTGFYGWGRVGFGVLDNRDILIGSF